MGSGMYTILNCITYPLAVVKTRMQASGTNMSSREAAADLMKTAGPRGFYAGLLPVLTGALPARAGYITALEYTRPVALLAAESAGLSSTAAATISNGAAGFAAVMASQLIYTPCDVVTQRMMVASGASGEAAADQSFSAVVRSVYDNGGLRGFYRGLGVTLLAYLPGGSVWWGAYGGARFAIGEKGLGQRIPETAERMVCSVWASFCTIFVTSPLDVLKTRVQLSRQATAPPLLQMGQQLMREEGLSGLYRGFMPRWAQASIFTSCVINIFEHLKIVCRKEV
jgi:solute carrier family 25 protein 44